MSDATQHKKQLDSLRCLAIAGVFLFHANDRLFSYGAMGVPLFFVLSGFLIARILVLHEGPAVGASLRAFYLRRTLRIFPLYYAVLVVLLASGRLEHPAWYFLYLHNVYVFAHDVWTGPTNHFWSLCVEEQFYLLYPLALLGAPRRWRMGLLGVAIVGSVLVRLFLAWQCPGAKSWALLPVAGEFLAWGCLMGLYEVRQREKPLPARRLVLAGLLLAGEFLAGLAEFHFLLLAPQGGRTVYPTLHAIGFALIVLGTWRLEDGWLLRALSVRPVVYLGKISYGLYVFHNFSYGVKRPLVEWLPFLQPVPGTALALAATVAVAMLSWHLFEHPINRLKDRFPYPERGAPGPGAWNQSSCLPFREAPEPLSSLAPGS